MRYVTPISNGVTKYIIMTLKTNFRRATSLSEAKSRMSPMNRKLVVKQKTNTSVLAENT